MSLRVRLQQALRDQLDRPSPVHATLLRLCVLRVSMKMGARLELSAPGSWEHRWMRGIRERAIEAHTDELVALALELERELEQSKDALVRERRKTVELAAA